MAKCHVDGCIEAIGGVTGGRTGLEGGGRITGPEGYGRRHVCGALCAQADLHASVPRRCLAEREAGNDSQQDHLQKYEMALSLLGLENF